VIWNKPTKYKLGKKIWIDLGVTVQNTRTHNMTPPRSFAHFVRSWVCGGRYGFNDEKVIRRDKRKRRR